MKLREQEYLEAIKRIDDVLYQAFETNHPIMKDYALIKIKLKEITSKPKAFVRDIEGFPRKKEVPQEGLSAERRKPKWVREKNIGFNLALSLVGSLPLTLPKNNNELVELEVKAIIDFIQDWVDDDQLVSAHKEWIAKGLGIAIYSKFGVKQVTLPSIKEMAHIIRKLPPMQAITKERRDEGAFDIAQAIHNLFSNSNDKDEKE